MSNVVTTRANSAGQWVAGAAAVFIAAWIVGLVVAIGGPGINDSATHIASYYVDHRRASMLGTYLIDGVAGAALIVFSSGLSGTLRRIETGEQTLSRIAVAAGTAAGAVSFVQAAFGIVLANHVAAAGEPIATRALFELLNTADTFKMLGLALLVGATTVLAFAVRAFPAWVGWIGAATVLALVVGGVGFVTNSSGLYAVLFGGLPLLLIWVASVGVLSMRGTPSAAG